MAKPRDKYYIKIYETLLDFNVRNDAPFSNENIRQAIRKFIGEEEGDCCNLTSDFHNVTADTFFQTPVMPNTQG